MRLPGRYPHSFRNLIEDGPAGPWMYTGGLENWPQLIRAMARRRPLWGNDDRPLSLCRRPLIVNRCLHTAGLPVLGIRRRAAPPSTPGRWLVKPKASAGGGGIRFWRGSGEEHPLSAGQYLQEFIEGEPAAAVYLGGDRQALFLGLNAPAGR